ncbi:transcriptional regulator [Chryseobacterium sp. NEB161]|nr:transcriptional regulator [Chryseobacterium sp. NEB161]
MNYILHLTGFYDRIQHDDRLNPTHISLYLALFQFWNLNHFQNPISISRNEMMRLSKISALGTYHKCIKQLQDFGYIEYLPSFNPYKGSLVNLHNFENSDVQNLNWKRIKKQTATEQAVNSHHIKIDTGIEQALIPSKNNINLLNNKHNVSIQKNISENNLVILNEAERSEESQKEKLREKKNNAVIARRNDEAILTNNVESVTLCEVEALQKPGSKIPPEFSEVQMYFEEKDSTKLEAEKFYNHYESNGWLVGGKSKMKNWQAGARNWLLNSKKFNPVIANGVKQSHNLKPSHLNVTTNKSYQDKL